LGLAIPVIFSINMDLRFYANLGGAVKTTVEVSDDLYRRAKSEAALRGRKLKDLVEEGLRLVLQTQRDTHKRDSLAELLKGARGVVNSGIADLASNPEHLKGFGRGAQRHR
jgi:hypothetical protein